MNKFRYNENEQHEFKNAFEIREDEMQEEKDLNEEILETYHLMENGAVHKQERKTQQDEIINEGQRQWRWA